jgi:hypothetical protein
VAANDHHTTDGPGRHSTATDQLSATATATSTAAPERARWPRLAAAPQPPLRSMLPRGYVGFTEATTPRHLVLPATTSVPLVVKILDSAHRPPAFVMGARGSSMVLEGDCAPSYLEVLLSPLGAYRLLGLPMAELSGQLVDLVEVLGPLAGAWANSSARRRAGSDGSGCWTGSCWGGWRVGRNPHPRSAGPGSGWSPPVERCRSAGSPARSAGATST